MSSLSGTSVVGVCAPGFPGFTFPSFPQSSNACHDQCVSSLRCLLPFLTSAFGCAASPGSPSVGRDSSVSTSSVVDSSVVVAVPKSPVPAFGFPEEGQVRGRSGLRSGGAVYAASADLGSQPGDRGVVRVPRVAKRKAGALVGVGPVLPVLAKRLRS